MEVVCLDQAVDDFIGDSAWDGLPFASIGDGAEVVRAETAVDFSSVEGVLSELYDENICGLHPVLLCCGAFMPVDSLVEFVL